MIGFLLLTAATAAAAASPAPAACGIANAERVTLEALLADPSPRARCVAVRGLWSGDALFRNRGEARRREGDAPRLGVHPIVPVRDFAYGPDFYTAVGNVFRCGGLPRDPGFCRDNPSGLYIAAADMRRDRWPTIRWDR